MSIVKGNIVKGNNSDRHAIVLAVRKDGTAAKIYEYGPDREIWVPVTRFTIVTAGSEQCYKCMGSGLFYMGGAVVNGRYTGKTGPCFGCEGNGEQTDADRLRCHYYWHRKVESDEAEGESRPLDANPQARMDEQPKPLRQVVAERRKSTKKNHPDPERKALGKPRGQRSHSGGAIPAIPESTLIDCGDCGTLHRSEVTCPW